MSKCVNVGKVTAYADAVAGGYTGTREQWEEAIANVGNEAVEALQAKNAAEAAASNSEAFANGTRDGEPVESDDPAYHKNAAYWAGEAAESARTLTLDTTLTQSGQAAEAKAVGDQLTDLKSALNSELVTTTFSEWDGGTWNTVNGNTYPSDTYIRNGTAVGLSTGTERIYCDSGYRFLLFAWDLSGNYIGSLKTGYVFDTTKVNYLELSDYPCGKHPEYIFKVALRQEPESSSITTAEGSHCYYCQITDKTLASENKAADAKAAKLFTIIMSRLIKNPLKVYNGNISYMNNDSTVDYNAIYYSNNASSDTYKILRYYDGISWQLSSFTIDTLPYNYNKPSTMNELANNIADIRYNQELISETGVNLFDKNHTNVIDGYISGTELKKSTGSKSIWIPCEPSTTYTVSKMESTRFSVAYSSEYITIPGTVDESETHNSYTEITITTSATARYLVVFLYNSETDTESFEDIIDTLQIEKGSEATEYAPFSMTAKDDVARSDIAEMGEHISISSTAQSAVIGSDVLGGISDMTAVGNSTYDNGVWTLQNGSGVTKTLNLRKINYLITFNFPNPSQNIHYEGTDPNYGTLTVAIGENSYTSYALMDCNSQMVVKSGVKGDVAFSVTASAGLTIKFDSITVCPVEAYTDIPFEVNGICMRTNATDYNVGFGNTSKMISGQQNTSYGLGAGWNLDTGNKNTAVGAYTQYNLQNGIGNTAVGNRAQAGLTFGTFNNAFGTVSQGNGTFEGSWNNAFGNETQRDITTGSNNTAMGRRAQSLITTGNYNTAIGSFTGFGQTGEPGKTAGAYGTKTASFQTLIGAEAIQGDTTPQNYATSLGFKTLTNEKAITIGALTKALGEKSVAIGYGVETSTDHEISIGDSDAIITIAGKRIVFNQDGSVTWTTIS